ncbi:MAG: hypothetical protein HY096_00335 [Nitrospinae bacterium]|nr:hypothetical protein [Nitrospinota bacterium]
MAKNNKGKKRNEAQPSCDVRTQTGVVKMVRMVEDAKGGPTEADVHPDEVDNFKKGGWKVQ